MMPADDEGGGKILRLVTGDRSRKEDRADRFLAALIILTQWGSRLAMAGWLIAIHLLAAVGFLSLIGR